MRSHNPEKIAREKSIAAAGLIRTNGLYLLLEREKRSGRHLGAVSIDQKPTRQNSLTPSFERLTFDQMTVEQIDLSTYDQIDFGLVDFLPIGI